MYWGGPLWRPWNPLHFWRLVLGPSLDKIFACVVIRLAAWRIEFIYRIKQVCRTTMPTCFWILVVSSPTCLWWKRGPVGNFFGQVPQRSGQSSIGKLTCQNLRQYTVNQSPAQWPHTRIFPGQTKLVLQPRSSTQTSTKNQTTSNRLTQSQPCSRSPKPTNDKQPTNQKEWLSAKYTWNALAQVWSAPFEEAPGLQC